MFETVELPQNFIHIKPLYDLRLIDPNDYVLDFVNNLLRRSSTMPDFVDIILSPLESQSTKLWNCVLALPVSIKQLTLYPAHWTLVAKDAAEVEKQMNKIRLTRCPSPVAPHRCNKNQKTTVAFNHRASKCTRIREIKTELDEWKRKHGINAEQDRFGPDPVQLGTWLSAPFYFLTILPLKNVKVEHQWRSTFLIHLDS